MEGYIKVAPETLVTTAGEFGGKADQLKALTTEMMNLINALSSAWGGQASEAYLKKFQALQTDMDKMYNMVKEHSTDLQEMARAYADAERKNLDAAQALQANILV